MTYSFDGLFYVQFCDAYTGSPVSHDAANPAVGTILKALTEVRTECSEWEREVCELFDEIECVIQLAQEDNLLAGAASTADSGPVVDAGGAVETPAESDRAEVHSDEVTGLEDTEDLRGLKHMVAEQTDVLRALVTALTQSPDGSGNLATGTA